MASGSGPIDLLCVGETMVLITPLSGDLESAPTAALTLAGAESNVAIQVADLGHRVAWLSRLGTDPMGRRIARELAERSVELLVEWDDDAPTGVMFKDPASDGSRVYYHRRGSAASRMTSDLVSTAPLDTVRIVHLSGITPALSASCRQMVHELVDAAHVAGCLISFDVNDRRALWSLDDAARELASVAEQSDLCFVGRDEAERLWQTSTPDQIRQFLPRVPTLVVKDAHVGATAYSGDATQFIPAPPVDVVEPVGAGDAFAAGYLSSTLTGAPVTQRLAAGHAAAARVLTIASDIPPRRSDDH